MESKFLIASRATSGFVAAAGLLVTVGWVLNVPLAALYGQVPLSLETGFVFFSTGAVLFTNSFVMVKSRMLLMRLAGAFLLVWGVLAFLNHLLALNISLGEVGLPRQSAQWIGTATVVLFSLFGLAMLAFHSRPLSWLGELLAALVGFAGLLVILGYLYGIPAFYHLGSYMGMALPTAVNFCLLSLAYLFSRTEVGFMCILASNTIAGAVARRLLPIAIFIPVALGWLHLLSERYVLFSTDFGTALVILSLILFFTSATIISLSKLYRLERAAGAAETERTRLESLRADASELLQRPEEIQNLLQDLSELIVQRVDAAFARVWTLDPSGQVLELQASAGIYTHINGGHARVPVGQYKIGKIAEERRSMVTNEVRGDLRVHDQEWVRRTGMIAFAGFPLMREDRLLGVMALFSRHKFSPGEVGLLETISIFLGQALARKRAEREADTLRQALLRANADLEQKVQKRTAKLQETVRELDLFSYTIAHDMRAPLRAMRGFGEMLLLQCTDCLSPPHRDFLQRIADAAIRLDHLITDALNYSQVVQSELHLQPVDPAPLLKGILESYPQLQPPHAEIIIEKHLPLVLGNTAGMTQCFSNLLDNAVKFVEPGKIPRVRVRAETRGEMVRFWFEDNGIGIHPEYHEIIFHMFQRLNQTYGGTGIGLTLVRKVMERMGGIVGLDSVPGQGSRFWLEYKRADTQGLRDLKQNSLPAENLSAA